MKFLDKFSQKLNKNQRIIVSIVFPLILLVIAIGLSLDKYMDLGSAVIIWIIFIAVVGYFEYKMWGNQGDNVK